MAQTTITATIALANPGTPKDGLAITFTVGGNTWSILYPWSAIQEHLIPVDVYRCIAERCAQVLQANGINFLTTSNFSTAATTLSGATVQAVISS